MLKLGWPENAKNNYMFVINDFFYSGKMTQPTFVELLNHADYEILNEYPFTIRRKNNGHEVSEFVDSGCVRLRLNGKKYMKHRLIAEQFLPNPHSYSVITHINNDKTDNHLSNLRWVSKGDRYIDEIDPKALVVDYYETKTERHLFRDYYYHEGVFYYDTDANYRILNINSTRLGSRYVWMYGTEGNRISVYIARFLEQHDML